MIDKNFSPLRKHFKFQEKIDFFLPNTYVLMAIERSFELLNEIILFHQFDLNNNQEILEKSPSNEHEYRKVRSFITRELWRIGSFIIFALNLVGILKREYARIKEIHVNLGLSSLEFHQKLLEKREKEIEIYLLYRNKIFAHTAFACPKKRPKKEMDNEAMKWTSLILYFGGLLGYNKHGVTLGQGCMIIEGKRPQKEFPKLSFNQMIDDFKNHFERWYEMLKKICDDIEQFDGDQILHYYNDPWIASLMCAK